MQIYNDPWLWGRGIPQKMLVRGGGGGKECGMLVGTLMGFSLPYFTHHPKINTLNFRSNLIQVLVKKDENSKHCIECTLLRTKMVQIYTLFHTTRDEKPYRHILIHRCS